MSRVSFRQFTDAGAQSYQRYFVPTIATAASGELLATAGLQRGERVLDVACGTGLIARLAAELVGPDGSVAGIDIAPDMIDVARTVAAPTRPAIEWRVADAVSLPFPDACYDATLCQLGLMFMDDRPAAVAEMRRVLVPGGRVVVNTAGTMQPLFEIMEQGIVDHIDRDLGGFLRAVFAMHDPEAVGTLLVEAGLRDVTSREATAPLRLPPPAQFLWQYISLTPMASVVAAAPEGDRAALEDQVVDLWRPYVVDGAIVIDQPLVVATGRR